MRHFLLFSLIILLTVSCARNGSQTDSVTEEWLNRCDIIIGAIDYYHDLNEVYPAALSELVPFYMTESPVPYGQRHLLKYQRTGESFQLVFEHKQPKYQECRYTPAIGWRCFGYE